MKWSTVLYSAGVFILGLTIGSGAVGHRWDKDKLNTQALIIEQQRKIKKMEVAHGLRESDIIQTFEQVKRDYENTITDVNNTNRNRLHESEERANHYRQEYKQCSDSRLVERAVQLDRHLSEGVLLVEELETIIRFKEQVIESLDAVIHNDRVLINAE